MMTKGLRVLLFMLCSLLHPDFLLSQEGRSVFSALDTQGRVIIVGEDQTGRLTQGDLLDSDGHRVQIWTLAVRHGQPTQVDLSSDDFDAVLYVVGPGLNQGLRNDDGGSGFDSRICFVADELGEYRVVVSSLDHNLGQFKLSVAAANDACPQTVDVDVDDTIARLASLPTDGRSLIAGEDLSGSLTNSDARCLTAFLYSLGLSMESPWSRFRSTYCRTSLTRCLFWWDRA